MRNIHISTWKGLLVILLVAVFMAAGIIWTTDSVTEDMHGNATGLVQTVKKINKKVASSIVEVFAEQEPLAPPPPPLSWDSIKDKGCVADGLLNGYGGATNNTIKMVNRSECEYLHRSIETWLVPPDFDDIKKNKAKITKDKMAYGMFIAEAIDTKSNYYYPAEDRDFEFAKMCRDGSKNFWGEHTCQPSLSKSEYRKYVQYISEQAMDLGVQSFMFGQVFYQDKVSEPMIPSVIEKMKEYAKFRGMDIIIGAQTNDIEDENYLRLFDYIEGGVGLSTDGTVEGGPCFSRWENWCWALLWHEKYKSKANNVLVHLDWSGRRGDDMSTFALMDQDTRAQTLKRLHAYFSDQDIGFLMPLMAVLPKDNGGCHGKSSKFYSADNKYTCKDEDAINKILK